MLEVEDARISTVYDGGGRQRSAGLELWVPGEDYPRRGSGQVIAGSSLDLEGLSGARGGLPLAARRPRGHRRVRADVADRAARRRVRSVLISDFGGVLTTPLQAGFLAYQEESGVSLEELGTAMSRAAEEYGDHPLFALERGEITEAEFRDRIEPHLENGFDLARLRELYFERIDPNRDDDRVHPRAARPRPARGAAHEQRPRVGAALAREAAGDRRAVRAGGGLGVRRPAQARSGDLRAHARAARRLGPEQCVFVDDLDVNCEAARALGMAAVRFEDAEQAIPEIESALAGE